MDDWRERFYRGNPSGKCSLCGSFGDLYHFSGHEDICPFCVIMVARETAVLKTPAREGTETV